MIRVRAAADANTSAAVRCLLDGADILFCSVVNGNDSYHEAVGG